MMSWSLSVVYTSTPQLPFKRPQIPSNRDHEALTRGTLGGCWHTSYFGYKEAILAHILIMLGYKEAISLATLELHVKHRAIGLKALAGGPQRDGALGLYVLVDDLQALGSPGHRAW